MKKVNFWVFANNKGVKGIQRRTGYTFRINHRNFAAEHVGGMWFLTDVYSGMKCGEAERLKDLKVLACSVADTVNQIYEKMEPNSRMWNDIGRFRNAVYIADKIQAPEEFYPFSAF